MNCRNSFCSLFLALLLAVQEAVSSVGQNRNQSTSDDEPDQLYTDKRVLQLPNKLQFESCVGHKNETGRCLPLEECVRLVQNLKIQIEYERYYCIYQQKKKGVCCPNTLMNPGKYDSIAKVDTHWPRRTIHKQLLRKKRNIADEVNVCGRNGRLLSQVLKNQRVENKAWPWVVSIINADTKEHHCGGTLVSRYHVLSAAHCVYITGSKVLKERILARLGEYDFKREDETRYYDHKVADIIYHEDYDEPTHENDISLLILERPARYNIYVQPACLPGPDDVYNQQTGVVIGWGTIEFAGRVSPVLREVRVPVWEHAECVNSYTQTVFTTNVCAAAFEGGKDACQKDSGGPLMIQREDGRWKIIGIVSWGYQCAVRGKPGIYVQVNKYLDWISDQLQDRIIF